MRFATINLVYINSVPLRMGFLGYDNGLGVFFCLEKANDNALREWILLKLL